MVLPTEVVQFDGGIFARRMDRYSTQGLGVFKGLGFRESD